MDLNQLANLGEFIGGVAVLVTLMYLARQIRQNTAQQKREETISIQVGQNAVLSQWSDPSMIRAYVRTADGEVAATIEERARAIMFVVQYLNHFQIVYDHYHGGSLATDRYRVWENFAVAYVASRGIREWWENESGKLGFAPELRTTIDQRLNDVADPPVPLNETYAIFSTEAWEADALNTS